jgi:hypothetical protein
LPIADCRLLIVDADCRFADYRLSIVDFWLGYLRLARRSIRNPQSAIDNGLSITIHWRIENAV